MAAASGLRRDTDREFFRLSLDRVLGEPPGVLWREGSREVAREVASPRPLPQVGVDIDHFQAREDSHQEHLDCLHRPTGQREGSGQASRHVAKNSGVDLGGLPTDALVVHVSDSGLLLAGVPGVWREQAMPYVAVEAMCCGAAVVASDAGSIPFYLAGRFAKPCS